MRRSATALINLVALTACGSSLPPDSMDAVAAGTAIPSAPPSVERDVCEETEVGLVEILAVDLTRRDECFGRASISFRAYLSPMIGVAHVPEQPSPGDGWLDPMLTPRRLLVPVRGEEERILAALVPPALSIGDVPTDQWAIVTGHFADPASESCGRVGLGGETIIDADSVEACRSLFILEGVRTLD